MSSGEYHYNRLPSIVYGFHGCDREVGLAILNGEMDQEFKSKPYHWLGDGLYFWENNPLRAFSYANDVASGRQPAAVEIKNPFVIGAILDLKHCLNLIESESLMSIKRSHDQLEALLKALGGQLEENKGGRKLLDYQVIEFVHKLNERDGRMNYDSVRGAYSEGDPIGNTTFKDKNHIQICIRNQECIQGYFLPRPVGDYNKYLKSDFKK